MVVAVAAAMVAEPVAVIVVAPGGNCIFFVAYVAVLWHPLAFITR